MTHTSAFPLSTPLGWYKRSSSVPCYQKAPVKSRPIPSLTLLLDQTFLTNAYVTLNFSGGKDAGISLGYAESLYKKGSNGVIKGNRNDVEGKEFVSEDR
jgi:alpha-L-rhamnosidase